MQQSLFAGTNNDANKPHCKFISPKPPATRFQGSKLKLLPWIYSNISEICFQSVLDGFGGSGCVSHFLKGCGKAVTYNDALVSGYLAALALVENSRECLSESDVSVLLSMHSGVQYDNFIERTFKDIYFTDEENAWLDRVVQNIPLLESRFKRAVAFYAIFQSALVKRPYNLFHRRNLYMRFAAVERSFGNKSTWDKPFESHFLAFVAEANSSVFESGQSCRALNSNVLEVDGVYDLVYLDPPYINSKGVGVDYFGFYHFLDGLADYANWDDRIDYKSKHRRLRLKKSPWTSERKIMGEFKATIDRFRHSSIVISYRSDGVPTPTEIENALKQVKKKVVVHERENKYKYALSTNTKSTELLFVGE
ncbi:MAG: putative methylase [Phycisphaerales bacterium]|nr:putative methylase [Phycisphaerales bacterium]